MHVWLCIRICVRAPMRVHLCIRYALVCAPMHVCLSMCLCMRTCACALMHVCLRVLLRPCICAYACVPLCMLSCMWSVHTHVCVCIYACVHMHMHPCACNYACKRAAANNGGDEKGASPTRHVMCVRQLEGVALATAKYVTPSVSNGGGCKCNH